MARRVTLKAISERCGVSHVAVGAALGRYADSSRVRLSDEKAAEIRRVAHDMGYQENKLATALRATHTRTIGVLFRVVSNPLAVSYLIDSCHRELLARDYHAHLWPFHSRFDLLEKGIRDLAGWQVDGLLISHLFDRDDMDQAWPELERWLRQIDLPVVMMESNLPTVEPYPQFNLDLPGAAAAAARHLAELGHRRLAFVGTGAAKDDARFAAARQAVPDLRLDDLQLDIHHASRPTLQLVETASQLAETLAGSTDRPTGYICVNDSVGAALCTSLQAHGIAVPEQASIIGFDNAEASMICSPALTTFDPPMAQLAAAAVDALLTTIEQPTQTASGQVLQPPFILRGSTAPLVG